MRRNLGDLDTRSGGAWWGDLGLKRGILTASLRAGRFCRNKEGCLLPSGRKRDGIAPLGVELLGESGGMTVADGGERWAALGEGQPLDPKSGLRTETGEEKEEEWKWGGGMLMGGGRTGAFCAGLWGVFWGFFGAAFGKQCSRIQGCSADGKTGERRD